MTAGHPRVARGRRRNGWAAGRWMLLALAAACSDLSGDSATPIVLEIRTPAGVGGGNPLVEISDSFQLHARALNQEGDSVAATFGWRTLDTALVSINPTTGFILGKNVGIARIQVTSGTLTSDLVSFSVVPAAETLVVVPPDSVRVAVADTASPALVSELDTLNPTGPLAGRLITYQIDSIFGAAGDTASLVGGVMARSVATSSLGQPAPPVYVRPIPSAPRPDSLTVRIWALRPSGDSIPGSGQRFIVRFD